MTIAARGAPRRCGLCHCLTCREHHGAPFNMFVVFARDDVTIFGATIAWNGSATYARHSCAMCGSPVYGIAAGDDEIELHGGNFPTASFTPEYEAFVDRREPWLAPLGLPQWRRNRGDGEPLV